MYNVRQEKNRYLVVCALVLGVSLIGRAINSADWPRITNVIGFGQVAAQLTIMVMTWRFCRALGIRTLVCIINTALVPVLAIFQFPVLLYFYWRRSSMLLSQLEPDQQISARPSFQNPVVGHEEINYRDTFNEADSKGKYVSFGGKIVVGLSNEFLTIGLMRIPLEKVLGADLEGDGIRVAFLNKYNVLVAVNFLKQGMFSDKGQAYKLFLESLGKALRRLESVVGVERLKKCHQQAPDDTCVECGERGSFGRVHACHFDNLYHSSEKRSPGSLQKACDGKGA
jgi:hypothetical protein